MAHTRLLVIEDDDAVGDLFVTVLCEEGYEVERAATTQQARDLLARQGADAFTIVLSNPFADPNRSPYAWLEILRQETTALIVICSGYPASFFADHRRRGFSAFLQEPFNLQDLVNLVASLANGKGE